MSYFVCGLHTCAAALEHSRSRVVRVLSAKEKLDPSIQKLVASSGARLEVVERTELSLLLSVKSHQDVAVELESAQLLDFDDLSSASEDSLVLLLDSVQDPQNLGAILRAAECFGVTAIGWQEDRSASLTPAATKASVGACELVPRLRVKNLNQAIDRLKALGFWIIGTDLEGDSHPPSADFLTTGKRVLIMGAEGSGIRKSVRGKLDYAWYFPLRGKVQSLNVSQATAVCLSRMQLQ